jgi:hypothetical protein
MPWITEEQLAGARGVDLLTYLQEREPYELVKSAPGEYRTKSHGSLVISNGAWYWNRGQFGGRSALNYLVKVQGLSLVAAVEAVSGVHALSFSPSLPANRLEPKRESKTLILPPPVKYPAHILSYLQGRGISADVIRQCLDSGSLYESRYNGETVCVFVGRDGGGKERFGCMRGINSDLKRDCAGSDKRFSFRLESVSKDCGVLMVFESPVDAISHFCLYPGVDAYRLSLGGTSDAALLAFLERNPQIKHTSLCLDADEAGQTAARKIKSFLAGDGRFSHITVTIDPPSNGKDYNEALLNAVRLERAQKQAGHRKEAGFSIE